MARGGKMVLKPYQKVEPIPKKRMDDNQKKNMDQLILEAFKHFDEDKSGYLEKDELRAMLNEAAKQQNQQEISEEFLNEVLEEYDHNNDGKIGLAEFYLVKDEAIDQLVEDAFHAYDKDNTGYLDFEEFKKVLKDQSEKNRGRPIDDKLINKIISKFDKNSDGKISLKEFKTILRGNQDSRSKSKRRRDADKDDEELGKQQKTKNKPAKDQSDDEGVGCCKKKK